jgi:nucleotide-binding universal stress UspA family protein
MIKLKKVLVPTDFSESARHALTYGTSFAREYEAELTLLHVVENLTVGYASDLFPVPMQEVFQEISGYAKTELAKLGAQAREKNVSVVEHVAQGKPSAEIIRFARETEIDMIVLGTHGKGMLDQALFGSTTERVVRRAPCPVLTVRLAEHEFVDGD